MTDNKPDPMFTCDDTLDDTCPRGDKCDMTVAYMAGAEREKTKVKGLMQIIESQKQTHDALVKKALNAEAAVRDLAALASTVTGYFDFGGLKGTPDSLVAVGDLSAWLYDNAETIKAVGDA